MEIRRGVLIGISCCTIMYGAYALFKMLYLNRIPYTIECTGLLLDSNKVYAISNTDTPAGDTIFIHFEQARALMPTTLGCLFYDSSNDEFCIKNNNSISNPNQDQTYNYFLPFCRTLKEKHQSDGTYFGKGDTVHEKTLIDHGIKYNNVVGTAESRVSIELKKINGKRYLKVHDDGIGTKYPVLSNMCNKFDIVLNQATPPTAPNVFYFDNTTKEIGVYHIEVSTNIFSAIYKIKNSSGISIASGSGSQPTFELGGFHFVLIPKYTLQFSFLLTISLLMIVAFQFYFIRLDARTASPVVHALFGIRVLLNSIVFLGLPVFLTSYYLAPGRQYYIPLVLVLNLSFFISKRFLHKINFHRYKKSVSICSWIVIAISMALMAKYTKNESLFGIPVLHIQKLITLLLISLTQVKLFREMKYGHWVRLAFIVICSLIISKVTNDIGSFLYTGLALLLVELVRKSIKLKTALLAVSILASSAFLFYRISPEMFYSRKFYRVIAPYSNPSSSKLAFANQSDKETYSSLIYTLKNVIAFKSPMLNDVIIPANMRSTCHSDFAFLWNFTFGGVIFFILFIITVLTLISNLILLLYCSSRPIRIREGVTFMLPSTREAEIVRFLIAFSIISFIYPLFSNTLIIPLTGQSIPCLSISNIEVLFIIWLLVSLSSIITNPQYMINTKMTAYYYGDAIMSMNYCFYTALVILVIAFSVRSFTLKSTPLSMTWCRKQSNTCIKDFAPQINYRTSQDSLTSMVKNVIGNSSDFASIPDNKKAMLKDIISYYYTGKRYEQNHYQLDSFSNSEQKLLDQLSIDSIFNLKSEIISGRKHPFGIVYAINQKVNNKSSMNVTNNYYQCVPIWAKTVNADLTAEANLCLESHIDRIGEARNIGSIMIVENNTGRIIANSSYPLISTVNSNDVYYFIGSLKKLLIAYCALKIDPLYFKKKEYNGVTLKTFIKNSDDFYAASSLHDLLLTHRTELDNILTADFNLPLYSLSEDSYLDILPNNGDFNKVLDRNNIIYRVAIGQQKPYKFAQAIQFYVRVVSGLKIQLNYSTKKRSFDSISMSSDDRKYLLECLNSVLYGTASSVRLALEENNISLNDLICKTGTAETADKMGNSASSFILSNETYTIGVMLKGVVPNNNQKLAAKDLFIHLIPLLRKYEILVPQDALR